MDSDKLEETDTVPIFENGKDKKGLVTLKLTPVSSRTDQTRDDMTLLSTERDSSVRRSRSLGHMDLKNNKAGLDENYLIGRRQCSLMTLHNNREGSRCHIMITEVAPSNSAIIPKDTDGSETSDDWKTPVRLFSEKRSGKVLENQKLSRRMRCYYKNQDKLIKAYEDIQLDVAVEDDEMDGDAKLQKRAEWLAKLSFGANLLLLIAKTVAVALSSSISFISSLVDSAVDLLSGIIIWYTSRAMKRRNIYLYPGGRSRLEPTAIVILSVIMSIASFQLIVESIQLIVSFTSKDGSPPTVNWIVIGIAISTIVIKFVLFLLCYNFGKGSNSVSALAQDHRNDVLSNIVAVICGYLGSQEFIARVNHYEVVYIDPIGAIIISIYILVNWWRTGYEQIKLLTGHTADPEFLSKITWICLNHHSQIIYIDTVRAFHFGNNYLVEVDIVLPETMSLKDAHNIGETLQQKLEKFPSVERAFVHLDYEIEHHPNEEHKPL